LPPPTAGSKLKEVGTRAREGLEAFFGKQVFLETRVVVKKDWRLKEAELKAFGYMPPKG
jgi:GTPase